MQAGGQTDDDFRFVEADLEVRLYGASEREAVRHVERPRHAEVVDEERRARRCVREAARMNGRVVLVERVLEPQSDAMAAPRVEKDAAGKIDHGVVAARHAAEAPTVSNISPTLLTVIIAPNGTDAGCTSSDPSSWLLGMPASAE